MWLRFLFITGSLVIALGGPISASTENTLCVQRQLEAAGFDPGPIDGVIGPATRQALADFTESRQMDTWLEITPGTAIVFCRRLAATDAELQAYWPSTEQRLDVTISENVDDVTAILIENQAHLVYQRAFSLLGLQDAGRDHVVVGTSALEVSTLVNARLEGRRAGPNQTMRERCDAPERPSGAAFAGVAYICLAADMRVPRDVPSGAIRHLLAHEAVHLVQFQTHGFIPSSRGNDAWVAQHGPYWLIEGVAEVVAAELVMHEGRDWLRRVIAEDWAENRAEEPFIDLVELEPIEAVRTHTWAVYNLGALAVLNLVDVHGFYALGDLYERMGQGVPFHEAFAAEFGISVREFYADFARKHGDGPSN